jgi:hypothetical protein
MIYEEKMSEKDEKERDLLIDRLFKLTEPYSAYITANAVINFLSMAIESQDDPVHTCIETCSVLMQSAKESVKKRKHGKDV